MDMGFARSENPGTEFVGTGTRTQATPKKHLPCLPREFTGVRPKPVKLWNPSLSPHTIPIIYKLGSLSSHGERQTLERSYSIHGAWWSFMNGFFETAQILVANTQHISEHFLLHVISSSWFGISLWGSIMAKMKNSESWETLKFSGNRLCRKITFFDVSPLRVVSPIFSFFFLQHKLGNDARQNIKSKHPYRIMNEIPVELELAL